MTWVITTMARTKRIGSSGSFCTIRFETQECGRRAVIDASKYPMLEVSAMDSYTVRHQR